MVYLVGGGAGTGGWISGNEVDGMVGDGAEGGAVVGVHEHKASMDVAQRGDGHRRRLVTVRRGLRRGHHCCLEGRGVIAFRIAADLHVAVASACVAQPSFGRRVAIDACSASR